MTDWRKQDAIPYIPVHRQIVPEGDYFAAHSDILIERFGRYGFLNLTQLGRELKNILGAPGDHFDTLTAHRALQKLNGQTPQIKIETAIQILGKELYQSLIFLLNLREDEAAFSKAVSKDTAGSGETDYAALFDSLKTRLARYKIDPENADAFRQVADSLFPRFQKLLATAANFGIWAGRFWEAARFLESFIVYHKEGKSYSFSDSFVPLYANPNFPFVAGAEWQSDPFAASGYQLLQGLELCLQNNVEGTHHASDPILHDLASNARLRIDLPSPIEMQEDSKVAFNDLLQTNIQGLRYHVEWSPEKRKYPDWRYYLERGWKIYHEFFEFYWDTYSQDRLFLKATRNHFDHTQYAIPITGEVVLENMEWFENLYGYSLAPKIETVANVRNENEPPHFVVTYPKSIEEGGLFCMELKELSDPEFDPLSIHWEQKEGPPVKLVKYNHGQKVCAQAPVTKGVEPPYQFVATVTDHPPSIHPVSKRKSFVEATVFHLPNVQLATGEPILLPEEVIRILTDPKKKDTGSVGLATGAHLYVFLRLPAAIENFAYTLNAPVAQEINVRGNNIRSAYSRRTWSNFVKVPGNVFAYMSASPIRPWTRPGYFNFDKGESLVDLKDRRQQVSVRVPVQGSALLQRPANAVQIDVGNFEWSEGEGHFVLPFSVDNPVVEGKPTLDLQTEIPIQANLASYIPAGTLYLSKNLSAQQISQENSAAKYRFPLQLPEIWLPPGFRATLEFSITNREGEEGKIARESVFDPRGSPNFWNAVSIQIPDTIMPFPWIFVELKLSDPKWSKPFSHLMNSRHTFTLTPSKAGEKGEGKRVSFELRGYPGWNWLKDDQTMIIPLRFRNFDAKFAKTWIKDGGWVSGSSTFSLPSEEPNEEWRSTIEWGTGPDGNTPLRLPPIPGHPEYPAPEFKKEPMTPLALLALLAFFKTKLKETTKKTRIETVESEIKAGESFHLQIELPDDPEQFSLKDLSAAIPLNEALAIHLSDPDQKGRAIYTLEAAKGERIKNSWTFTYNTPDYLPKGKYRTQLQAQKTIAADYVVTRKIGDGGDLFQHPITTEFIPNDERRDLKLVVIGKEELEEPVGKGGLAK